MEKNYLKVGRRNHLNIQINQKFLIVLEKINNLTLILNMVGL